jgi:hypothetical protein
MKKHRIAGPANNNIAAAYVIEDLHGQKKTVYTDGLLYKQGLLI